MHNFWTRIWRAVLLVLFLGATLLSATGCCGSFTTLFMGRGPAKGEPSPDFTLTSLKDEQVTLSELQGQAVLIVFWSST
jgi:cytochrome oxidase Cu insertion factor (SCO1/SenC/PrrC family)